MNAFPSWADAPESLHLFDGNCGLISVWGILRYFGKRTNTKKLVETTGYTRKNGVFGIGAAASLASHGLAVVFFSDPDPNPHRSELALRKKATGLNIQLKRGIGIEVLLSHISYSRIGLVLYDKPKGEAHLSPLLGIRRGCLELPYDLDGAYSTRAFSKVWNKPGILRQSMIISR